MFEPAAAPPAFLSPQEINALQDRLLAEHAAYVAERSPFYRRRFQESGLAPDAVKTVADLAKLPLTSKQDLAENARDLLCVDESMIVDTCLTSGTTGRPVPLYQTASDLDRLGYNEETAFRAAGITEHDRVMIAAAMDRCFMAGLAYFLALKRIGANSIRAGSSSLPVLTDIMRTYKPTAIVGVPTLILALAERLAAEGVDPASLGTKRLICIGEPVRKPDFALSALGERIGGFYGASVYGTYASTEMATAFCDCEEGMGGHLLPDLMVVEIIDDQGRPLPPGQPGEVVATPLQVTGMPLMRFATGDIAVLHPEPCPCGRLTPRLGPVQGRKAQGLKYRGTLVYPPAIFQVLQEIPALRGYYIEVRDDFELSDHIRVVAGSTDPDLTPLEVAERIAACTRVKPEVVLAHPDEVAKRTIQPGQRKPVLFFDLRTSAGGSRG